MAYLTLNLTLDEVKEILAKKFNAKVEDVTMTMPAHIIRGDISFEVKNYKNSENN
jgi:hypothetical protein